MRCGKCGKEFDDSKEVGMGAVECPHCGYVQDQAGKGHDLFFSSLVRNRKPYVDNLKSE